MSAFSLSLDLGDLGMDELADGAEEAARPAAQAGAQVFYDRAKANVAKLGKVAKVAPRAAEALETLAKHRDALARASRETLQQAGLTLEQVAAARAKALAKAQDDMLAAKAAGKPGCTRCPVEVAWAKRKHQMPADAAPNGSWVGGKQPADGNGTFEFTEAKKLPKALPDGTDAVKTIEFKNGAPDFDKYVEGGKHDLWVVTGNADKDASELRKC